MFENDEMRSTERVVKRTMTHFVAGPDIWNSLTPEIRLTDNFAKFKKKLKTHLFDMAFP